ncbi:hypothetical protein I302_101080 [Kwoniella bestiolae CBS 10118]|uniref:Uncharacterized protein n=1 Tax=Kwoniella bestiolae CBS 10118 TaxID=1296100 RepID=A0A1B9G6W2_9TREE|nr:hypothetical protein I302_04456 [Kwoniella bestiolae CBS 10118]OCF26767.1 hypothetical protein I302_04456 [Kwoniella bestiolae CBS 10118]
MSNSSSSAPPSTIAGEPSHTDDGRKKRKQRESTRESDSEEDGPVSHKIQERVSKDNHSMIDYLSKIASDQKERDKDRAMKLAMQGKDMEMTEKVDVLIGMKERLTSYANEHSQTHFLGIQTQALKSTTIEQKEGYLRLLGHTQSELTKILLQYDKLHHVDPDTLQVDPDPPSSPPQHLLLRRPQATDGHSGTHIPVPSSSQSSNGGLHNNIADPDFNIVVVSNVTHQLRRLRGATIPQLYCTVERDKGDKFPEFPPKVVYEKMISLGVEDGYRRKSIRKLPKAYDDLNDAERKMWDAIDDGFEGITIEPYKRSNGMLDVDYVEEVGNLVFGNHTRDGLATQRLNGKRSLVRWFWIWNHLFIQFINQVQRVRQGLILR